jgi:hypothetical protein
MKYLKAFEDLGDEFDSQEYNIYRQLVSFLTNINRAFFSPESLKVIGNYSERGFGRSKKNGTAIALQYKDPKEHRFSFQTIFSIRIMNVSDKKLRDYRFSPKLRIRIDKYKNISNNTNELVIFLYEFIVETFKKYSYFNKYSDQIYHRITDFYINTKDVPNIMKELNYDDFEIYKNAKKYNL